MQKAVLSTAPGARWKSTAINCPRPGIFLTTFKSRHHGIQLEPFQTLCSITQPRIRASQGDPGCTALTQSLGMHRINRKWQIINLKSNPSTEVIPQTRRFHKDVYMYIPLLLRRGDIIYAAQEGSRAQHTYFFSHLPLPLPINCLTMYVWGKSLSRFSTEAAKLRSNMWTTWGITAKLTWKNTKIHNPKLLFGRTLPTVHQQRSFLLSVWSFFSVTLTTARLKLKLHSGQSADSAELLPPQPCTRCPYTAPVLQTGGVWAGSGKQISSLTAVEEESLAWNYSILTPAVTFAVN